MNVNLSQLIRIKISNAKRSGMISASHGDKDQQNKSNSKKTNTKPSNYVRPVCIHVVLQVVLGVH